MMKNILLILVATSLLSFACIAQHAGYPDFELVESVPIETTLDNSDIRNTLEVWLEMIRGAKKSLDIEQFYISNHVGEPLDEVIAAIVEAGGRGITVRIIVDMKMHKTYPEPADSLGKLKNISTRIIDFGKLGGGIQHAKFFIVDGEQVFFGSQNFDWRALKHIHELGLRIRHKEGVEFYQDIFNADWNFAAPGSKESATPYPFPKTSSSPFFVVNSRDTAAFTPTASPLGFIPDSSSWDETNIVRLVDGAQKNVSLQFLGYTTKGRDKSEYLVLDNALRRAAARGVTVRMIVSDWEKATPAEKPLKELAQVPNIELKFSVIPDWSGGYVSFARVEHCKYVVVDGKVFWLGTSNAEKSYFYTSRNIGVVVKDPVLAPCLDRIFMRGWDGKYTERVNPEVKYQARKHGEK